MCFTIYYCNAHRLQTMTTGIILLSKYFKYLIHKYFADARARPHITIINYYVLYEYRNVNLFSDARWACTLYIYIYAKRKLGRLQKILS